MTTEEKSADEVLFKGFRRPVEQEGQLPAKRARSAAKNKPYACDVDECRVAFTQSYNLVVHKRTHASVRPRPYICGYEECQAAFFQRQHLVEHKKTHSGVRPHVCDYEGCRSAFASARCLTRHKRTHTGVKPYVCDFEGCRSAFVQSGNLVVHKRTHLGLKPYRCDFEGCESAFFSEKDGLSKHRRRHSGVRPYVCDFEGCRSAFSESSHLTVHKRSHSGVRPYVCNYEGCRSAFASSSYLTKHKRTHTGVRPYVCDYEGCRSAFAQSCNLTVHKKTHTIEGQIRRKKQENRVNKMLTKWGYTADCETTINALSGKCLTDTQRYFSRLDFRIVNCFNAMCILEVDEDQHYWYNLSCEMSRMADVRASLALAGHTTPIYWIRYNPNGKYHVGSEEIKINRTHRENLLEQHLATVCSPDFKPDHQENIHYMFYDLLSEEEGPEITRDENFPRAMIDIVSWCKVEDSY